MSKITNYCLIDHVGSVEQHKLLYKQAYETAKNLKVEHTFKMNQFCKMLSPYMRKEPSQQQKLWVRLNKSPAVVILICDSLSENSYAKSAMDAWTKRGIHTIVLEDKHDTYDFGLQLTTARRCALIWANALGWEFSAPLIRDQDVNTPDPWHKGKGPKTKRQLVIYNYKDAEGKEHKAIRWQTVPFEDPLHPRKVSTNPKKFLDAKHVVASEEEVQAFYEHYKYLYRAGLLQDMLEPDYRLCPHCKRPYKVSVSAEQLYSITKSAPRCPNCEALDESFAAEQGYIATSTLDDSLIPEVTSFYEDSFLDDEDILDNIFESEDEDELLPF